MAMSVQTVNDIVVSTRRFHQLLANSLHNRALEISFPREKMLLEYLSDREEGIADLLRFVEDDEDALKLGNWFYDYVKTQHVLFEDVNTLLSQCETSLQIGDAVSNIYTQLQELYELMLMKSDTEPAHEKVESILTLYQFVARRNSLATQHSLEM